MPQDLMRQVANGDRYIEIHPGLPFTVSVTIRGWNQQAIQALPHPESWNFVGMGLFPHIGPEFLAHVTPRHRIAQDGETVSLTLVVPADLAQETWYDVVISFTDEQGAHHNSTKNITLPAYAVTGRMQTLPAGEQPPATRWRGQSH
jgi:hypothetical protein